MKLSVFKGIAHDLASSLDLQAFSGYWRDLKYPVDTDASEEKDSFDRSVVAFVKERVPDSFDWKRVEKIIVRMRRSAMSVDVKVVIEVDGKEFSYGTIPA